MRHLLAHPERFDFFQAVAFAGRLFPDAAPLGRQGPPSRERIRLRPSLSLAFSNADVASIELARSIGGESRVELEVTFLGLYGSSSPLPAFYTEDLLAYKEDGLYDPVREFLDLFHHRLLSLLFRVGYKYRIEADYTPAETDYFATRLPQLAGLAPDGEPLTPRRLSLAAALVPFRGSASGLTGLLQAALPNLPIAVEQCVARWIAIPAGQRNALGNSRLGHTMTLGARVYDRACTIGVRIGPMDAAIYREFLPNGRRLAQLLELIELVNDASLDVEIVLIVNPSTAGSLALGSPTASLGWSTWVGNPPSEPQEVRFFYPHGRRPRQAG